MQPEIGKRLLNFLLRTHLLKKEKEEKSGKSKEANFFFFFSKSEGLGRSRSKSDLNRVLGIQGWVELGVGWVVRAGRLSSKSKNADKVQFCSMNLDMILLKKREKSLELLFPKPSVFRLVSLCGMGSDQQLKARTDTLNLI